MVRLVLIVRFVTIVFNINDNDKVGNYEKQELIKGDPRTQNVSFEDFFQHHTMVGGLGVECVALE